MEIFSCIHHAAVALGTDPQRSYMVETVVVATGEADTMHLIQVSVTLSVVHLFKCSVV